MNVLNFIRRDFSRVILPLLLCVALVVLALWLPRALGVPELAPALLFAAFGFLALTLAHLARRVLFRADLHDLIERAAEAPTGAGLCVLGICIILAVLINTFATLFSR